MFPCSLIGGTCCTPVLYFICKRLDEPSLEDLGKGSLNPELRDGLELLSRLLLRSDLGFEFVSHGNVFVVGV